MNVNRLIVPAGILMAAVLIIAGGYVILTEDKQLDKKPAEPANNNDTAAYIENTTKEVHEVSLKTAREWEKQSDIMSDTNLTKDAKPAFNIGDRWVYELFQSRGKGPSKGGDGVNVITTYFDRYTQVDEYRVVDKIRWNKTEYLKIQVYHHPFVVGTITTKEEGTKPMIVGGINETVYLNPDTGEAISGIETSEIENLYSIGSYFFMTWMLALDDNLKTKKEVHAYEYEQEFIELSVEGREKINGRECFKVKQERLGCNKNSNCKVMSKWMYYVDVNKRILVKYDAWFDNVLLSGGELTEENTGKTSS